MSWLLGFGYALITAALWSLNPAFISRYRGSLQPILFTGLRALLALLPALLLCVFVGFNAEISPLTILLFTASALIGPGIGDAAYTKAIQIIGGGRAVVVAYTYIFVAQALSILVGEVLKLGVVVGAFLAFLGLIISAPKNSGGSEISLRGFGYAAAASLCWGVGTVLSTVSLHYADPISLVVIRLGIIVVFFIPAGLLSIRIRIDYNIRNDLRKLVVCSGLTGIVGWFGGMYFFLLSLATIGTASTVLATALTPILSMITTRNVAREIHSSTLVLGAALMSLGIGVAAFLS
ncbi:MAG: DMT family transporter [Desulfurococcaceae archaeon TW002]